MWRSSSAPSRSARCTTRRGLGVYYRYSPRHVSSLCHDPANQVEIAEPKIHHSVLKRIANNTSGYAPAGLPTSYRGSTRTGRSRDPDPDTYETRQAARAAPSCWSGPRTRCSGGGSFITRSCS